MNKSKEINETKHKKKQEKKRGIKKKKNYLQLTMDMNKLVVQDRLGFVNV